MIIVAIRLPILLIWSLVDNTRQENLNCRYRNRLIEDARNDFYAPIDAFPGQKLELQCHYCNENDDGAPKIWYKQDSIGSSHSHEVPLAMNTDPALNKFQVSIDHNLKINNFESQDVGLYYCQRLEENQQDKFNYLIDLIYSNNINSVETGNLTNWRKYYEDHFVAVNLLFRESKGVEFRKVREEYKMEMELVTQWQPWGICQICGRSQGDGVRKRTGVCRIKLTKKNSASKLETSSDENFFKNLNAISCKSQLLGRLLPGISNSTRVIPNFVHIENCGGKCNPDAEGLGKGWKTGKTTAFKYRKRELMQEHSHLAFICPESTIENHVIWKRNGKVLEAGKAVQPPNPEDDPRILVDTFNTLYLVDVQESEAGNYTCQVDDIRMQQVIVFVVTKSKIFSQAFVRHFIYLGMILALVLPCYCSGVIISCSRRRFFKSYQDLKEDSSEETRGLI